MIETLNFNSKEPLIFFSFHAAFLQAKVSAQQNWHNSKESVWLVGKGSVCRGREMCVGRDLIGGRDSDVIELAVSFTSCENDSRRWRQHRTALQCSFILPSFMCTWILS